MKPLSNLILACAKRKDAVLWMQEGAVHVCVGRGALSKVFSAQCNDDKAVLEIIKEISHGAYALCDSAQRKEAA